MFLTNKDMVGDYYKRNLFASGGAVAIAHGDNEALKIGAGDETVLGYERQDDCADVVDKVCIAVGDTMPYPSQRIQEVLTPDSYESKGTDVTVGEGAFTANASGVTNVVVSDDDTSRAIEVHTEGNYILGEIEPPTREFSDIILQNTVSEMKVGDERVLYAYGLSSGELIYDIKWQNAIKWKSSDNNVCSVNFGCLKAVGKGVCRITASDLNERCRKSFFVTVTAATVETYSNDEIYNVDASGFADAETTTVGIQAALDYARDNGYKKIVFPFRNYDIQPDYGSIEFHSNIVVDFQGSTLFIQRGQIYTDKTGYQMFKVTDVENFHLMNTKIYGEHYSAASGGVEGNRTMQIYGLCKNLKFTDCEFSYSSGFNVAIGWQRKILNWEGVYLDDVELGGIDENGNDTDDVKQYTYRNKTAFKILDEFETDKRFCLGHCEGNQDYHMRSLVYDIFFYSGTRGIGAEKYLGKLEHCLQFEEYSFPEDFTITPSSTAEGKLFARVMFWQPYKPSTAEGNTHTIVKPFQCNQADNVIFERCKFEYNASTGFSPQGGRNIIVRNCTFTNNGLRDPYAHIDWEDGRNLIFGHIVENCTFTRTNNTYLSEIANIYGGGTIVFKNNVVNGGYCFNKGKYSHDMKIYGNTFINVPVWLNTYRDMTFVGNTFTNNPSKFKTFFETNLDHNYFVMADNKKI